MKAQIRLRQCSSGVRVSGWRSGSRLEVGDAGRQGSGSGQESEARQGTNRISNLLKAHEKF